MILVSSKMSVNEFAIYDKFAESLEVRAVSYIIYILLYYYYYITIRNLYLKAEVYKINLKA